MRAIRPSARHRALPSVVVAHLAARWRRQRSHGASLALTNTDLNPKSFYVDLTYGCIVMSGPIDLFNLAPTSDRISLRIADWIAISVHGNNKLLFPGNNRSL